MDKQHEKEKLKFQVERIAFFSDAVIAIALTLLIIEIKAPKIETGSAFSDQMAQLTHLIPEFIAFIISFIIILLQWKKHHHLFGNIINYDEKLITLNSIFLFAIAIVPFSTSYFAHNTSSEFYLPIIVYGSNLFILTVSNYLIFNHVANGKFKLIDNSLSVAQIKFLKIDYLLFPTAILIGILSGLINLRIGFIAYVLVLTIGSIMNKSKK